MEDVTVAKNTQNHFRWYLNSTSMQVAWENPTLIQIQNKAVNFSSYSGVIEVPNAN
jgi:uncharacterized membrane protein